MIHPSGGGTSSWLSREAEPQSGFVPLLLHPHPCILLPSAEFTPLTPSNTDIVNQGVKVSGAQGGHHHSTGEVREDGRREDVYYPLSWPSQSSKKSLVNYRNVIDLSKIHEVSSTGYEMYRTAFPSLRNLSGLC